MKNIKLKVGNWVSEHLYVLGMGLTDLGVAVVRRFRKVRPVKDALEPMTDVASLRGGAMDGGTMVVKEGTAKVAVLLLENKETGDVECYERRDGVYASQNGVLVAVYRWTMTVGRRGNFSKL